MLIDDLLIKINFFQHERLIHLIVTVTFAISTMIALLCTILYESAIMYILLFLFLVLLLPYVRHYFILERGVQKMYDYYDKLL